jgi:hypothetical protein
MSGSIYLHAVSDFALPEVRGAGSERDDRDDYVSEPGTYYELSSGAAPAEDFKDHTHLLFCLIEKLLEHISWIEGWLQMVRFGRRESLWQREPPPRKECPNAWKARKQGKKDMLHKGSVCTESSILTNSYRVCWTP